MRNTRHILTALFTLICFGAMAQYYPVSRTDTVYPEGVGFRSGITQATKVRAVAPVGGALTMTADVDAEQTVSILVTFTGSLTVDWGDGSEPEAMVDKQGEAEIPNLHEYSLSDTYTITITGDLFYLTEVWCYFDSITYINVEDCVSLNGLFVGFNSLTESAITSLISTMVDRTGLDAGSCVLVPQSETFPQTLTAGQCSALSAINWVEIGVPCPGALTMTADVEAEQTVSILVVFSGSLTIDWGDGSEPEVMVSETESTHEYASADAYDISITGDLTGVTEFISSHNSMTDLDVSSCTSLSSLNCDFNTLSTLDISALTALTILDCSDNSITALDVVACTSLASLSCNNNPMTESAITTLIGTMVDRTALDAGVYVITPMNETFPQELTEGQTNALTAKNWAYDE